MFGKVKGKILENSNLPKFQEVTLTTTTAAADGVLGGYVSSINTDDFTTGITGTILDIIPKNARSTSAARKGGVCYRAGSNIYVNAATVDTYYVTCTIVYK